MQLANILLQLGGDAGMTVPKYNVTPSEIAVLLAIHGPSAVTEIEPLDGDAMTEVDGGGSVKRTDRQEIERLGDLYGRTKIAGADGEISVMRMLFPGAGSRAIQTLDELGIDESFYKAMSRAKPAKADPLDHDEDGKKGGSKSRKAKAEDPEPEQEELFG